MDEEQQDRTKRDEEQRDQRKRDKEQRVKDKLDEENYLKSIQWPKSDDEWINYDFNKLKPGTLMPFKTPPRHQIEPDIERNPDGTIVMEDKKQKQIDRLTEHLALMTKQINVLTSEIKSKPK